MAPSLPHLYHTPRTDKTVAFVCFTPRCIFMAVFSVVRASFYKRRLCSKDADKPLYKPKAPSSENHRTGSEHPRRFLDPPRRTHHRRKMSTSTRTPCNCIRTFTKSIGCVRADAIPRAPSRPSRRRRAWCSRGFSLFCRLLSLSLFVFLFPARSLLRAAMVDRLKVVIVLDWIS